MVKLKILLRGKKRRILEIVINSDVQIDYRNFPLSNIDDLNREQIIERMLDGGVWPFLR